MRRAAGASFRGPVMKPFDDQMGNKEIRLIMFDGINTWLIRSKLVLNLALWRKHIKLTQYI